MTTLAGALASSWAPCESPIRNAWKDRFPPLPHTTPHTLRRTYISIALLANSFDVKWMMAQVGHADSRMTTQALRPDVRFISPGAGF